MKSIFRVIIPALISLASLFGCGQDQPVEPVLLELDRTNMKMTVGQSQQLNAVLKGSDEECVWKTADASVAVVEQDGTVEAVGAGKTVITVSAAGLSKECNVEVADFKADALELNEEISEGLLIIPAGEDFQLNPKFYKAGEKVNDLAFPVFNVEGETPSRTGEDVLSIDKNGLIKAMAPGQASITVAGAGISKTFTLMVKELVLDRTSLNLYLNESVQLTYSLLPEALPSSEKSVEWFTSDKESVSVDAQGNVKALKVISAPVQISLVSNEMTQVCNVTVSEFTANSVEFADLDEKIRKNAGKYEMYVGDSPVSLTVVFKDASGKDVTGKVAGYSFASSDKSVATVSATGEVKALASGKTTVSVSGAGVQKSFELNVIQGVESIQITPSGAKSVLEGDEPFAISAVVLPENATVKTVSFKSDKPEVASVDSKSGMVTIGQEGVAKITVTTEGFKRPVKGNNGSYAYETLSATLIVNVAKPSVSGPVTVSIEAENIVDGVLYMTKGTTAQLRAVTDPADFRGTFRWMVTNDNISVDDSGKLTGVSVGSSVVAVMAVSNGGSTSVGELPVQVTGINPTAIEITNGASATASVADAPITLSARATAPSNVDFAGVNWYSSNENIVTVNQDGKLTYTGVGKAVITAKAKTWDGKSELPDVKDEFSLELLNAAVTDCEIVHKEGGIIKDGVYYLEKGSTMTLKCATIPQGTIPQTIVWKSENTSIATVNADGVVTGINFTDDKGTDVVITCVVDGSMERTFTVRVVMQQPRDIQVTLPGRALKVGESWNMNPKVIPEFLNLTAMPSFGVPVTNGIFKASEPDTYYVGFYVSSTQSVSILNTLQKTFTITVDPYWVETISIPSTYELEEGGSAILVPEFTSDVNGIEPYDKTVTWVSMNESIVKVDSNGKLTAVAAGTADVKVMTSGRWSVPGGSSPREAICRVTVKKAANVISVGDFYYSDGTTSSELQSGKTVVGVVISRDNATSTDKFLPAGCNHGLVVVLNEAEGSWSSSYEAGSVNSFALSKGYQNTTGTYYNSGAWAYVRNDYAKMLLGYNNTKAMKEYMSQNGYTSGILSALDACGVNLPDTASALYIPSIAEMDVMFGNASAINASLKAAGGVQLTNDQYWTTSENEASAANAATVNPLTGALNGGKLKSASAKVRFIFAF